MGIYPTLIMSSLDKEHGNRVFREYERDCLTCIVSDPLYAELASEELPLLSPFSDGW